MKSLLRLLTRAGCVAGLVPAALSAQQATTISGRVVSEANTPLEGVAVSIPELRIGGYTDATGRYTIQAPSSGRTAVLRARRVGYRPDSARVVLNGTAQAQDFRLEAAATQITGVVVTALGIEREKSQLGTSQQQVTSADLNTTKAQNLIQQVQGKVSGVTISGSGTPGGSTNILIRGANTINSNNQPLFIVDGIPVSNSNRGGGLGNGYDFGNAISDINPEDVESMTILKGPNAAAIYGSRAQNGAVVITTKKGAATRGKMRTELTTLYTWEAPGRLPDFQNQYGQGANGQFKYVDGAGGGTFDGADQSWGPKLDGRLIDQFTGKAQPWIARPNNVRDFFETGHTMSSTLAVSGGTDRANARMSVGVDNIKGYVPNNSFQKTSGLLTGNLQVTPKFSTDAVLQYVRNNGRNRPGTGYNNSILEQFFWFGRQVDINALRDYAKGGAANGGPASREFNWNYNYHNNPFYIQNGNDLLDSRDRFIVQGGAKYQITDWLDAALRSGSDIFRFNADQRFGSAFLNGAYVNPKYLGGFNFLSDYRNEHNTEVRLNANRAVTPTLALQAMLGGNIRKEQFQTTTTQTSGISVAGIYNVSNAAITPTLSQRLDRRNMNSVFGSAAATYNGYLTVEVTGRNDVSSTLPKGQNSYFYPSVNTSFIVTDAVKALQNDWLSYLKVRASVAEVGNDTDPYQLATTFTGLANKFGGRPQFTLGDNLLEPKLKPELTHSTEGGIEAGFFGGRVTLDLTYYDKATRNQIYLVPVSPTTGYANKLINAGKMSNKGVEALLSVTPIETPHFKWTSTANYSKNKNLVAELAPGVQRFVLGNGLFGDVRLEATRGQPYGAIWGGGFQRDSAGRILIDGGHPIATDTFVYLGNIQPKWTGGWANQVTYRSFSLGALFDIRRGGKIMSYTNYVGAYSGVLQLSLLGREVDFNKPGVVAKGIDVNTGKENTVSLTSEDYFQNLFGIVEPYVYDASYTKLRELRIGYDLPAPLANKLYAQSISLALTGRNLFIWTSVPNIDPEFTYSSGNFQGIEYAFPGNTKSVGLQFRITP